MTSPPLVLDFDTISREFRSVVTRRREQMLFLGSVFAATSLFLQNVLDGELPDAMKPLEQRAFLLHSILMIVPTTLIALRIARMHTGMTINGVYYRRALRQIDPFEGSEAALRRAASMNYFGVSAMQFWLAAFLASGEAMLLALALGAPGFAAPAVGLGVLVWLVLTFLRMHANAGRFALRAVENCRVEPFTREDDERHLADSRNDANQDLNACIGFVGLMLFASLEGISGVGQIAVADPGVAAPLARQFGPLVYDVVLLTTCLANILMYCRLAASVADMSLRLDPTDTPFRPFKPTDTLFGYLMIVFFTAVAVHLTAYPYLDSDRWTIWIIDAATIAIALAFYPARMQSEAAKRKLGAAMPGRAAPPGPGASSVPGVPAGDGAIAAPAKTPPGPPPPAA